MFSKAHANFHDIHYSFSILEIDTVCGTESSNDYSYKYFEEIFI